MVKQTSLLVLLLGLHLANLSAAASSPVIIWAYKCDDSNGNYTSNSSYKQNLDYLVVNMMTSISGSGFTNSSFGESPDVVYLTSLCIGNLPESDCRQCQTSLNDQISSYCSYQRIAVYWSDKCMMRYSTKPMFGIMQQSPYKILIRGLAIGSSEEYKYNHVLQEMMAGLPGNASEGNSSLKFATSEANFNSSVPIYSAAQCTPDLTRADCLRCLTSAVNLLEYQASSQRGARILFPSCSVRYEENKFYLSTPNSTSTTTPNSTSTSTLNSTNKGGNGTKKMIVVVVVIVGLIGFILVTSIASFIFITKGGRFLFRNLHTRGPIDGDDISNVESFHFNFSAIRAATGNFSEANKLGQGGFGTVYKGMLPGNQKEIAVKRLAGNSFQGEEEFKTEIKLLAKLQHRNLVRLLGFSLHNTERLLIYEFVPNASLDHFLFGATRRAHLEWESRYRIISGIARGILYLQEDSRLRIIHRDIKASNVLLDAEMCPKIADFGTARLFDIHQTHSDTRRIVGTYGYMAPEYALHGNFSTKSDVYSFGILLLEIVCGKRCNTLFGGEIPETLISFVWRKWSDGRPFEVVDSSLKDGSESDILRCIHIGLLCVQDNMAYRPTMSSVVRMMNSFESTAFPNPLQPAYVMASNLPLSSQDILSIDSSTSLESITELYVR